jgi:hypothetical protein
MPEPKGTEEAIANLRAEWVAPDGWFLADAAFEVYRVARQLGRGFYYRHDPRPPEDWFNARRAWCSFVRKTLESSREFDSEFQVASACDLGRLPTATYRAWQNIKPTFEPNTVPEWLSYDAIEWVREWEREHPESLIWVEYVAFGERLSAVTGWPFFSDEGLDARGNHIERHRGTAIVSVAANSTGRNLQAWSKNLFVAPLSNGVAWEQAIGRTHRDGQMNDVEVHTFVVVQEDRQALDKSIQESRYTYATTGQEQKLLIGDWQ